MENSYIMKIEKALKYILGDIYYIKIKNFFAQFYYTDKYDYIIFTTRRCHILFCIFEHYFFKDYNNKNITFISDKSLHFYNDDLKNCNCAIVDDILIHGRALKSVYERVSSKCQKEIETFVFMQSKDALYPADHCVEDLVEKSTWKKFSNKIVSAIIMSSFPYTSYIYSSFKTLNYSEYEKLISKCQNIFPTFTKSELSLNEIDNSNYLNELLEKYIECYIFDVSEFSELYGLEFSCLRLYYNKYLNCCIATPYSITNAMTSNDIDDVLNNYFDTHSKIVNVKKYETKYRAITSLYSLFIFYYLNKKYSLDFLSWSRNNNYIDMSYYDSFYSEIKSVLTTQNIKTISKNEVADFILQDNYVAHKSNSDDVLENDIYTSAFIDCVNNSTEKDSFYDTHKNNSFLSKWFYNYLAKVNFLEEDGFSNIIPEKQLGLSFETIASILKTKSDFVENNNITKFDLYSKLISSADSGFLSIFADYCFYIIDEKKIKFYSNYLITGEHVCRLYQNKYIVFVLELFEMYEELKQNFKLKYSKDEIFDKFLIEIKKYNVQNNIINNLKSAYKYIESSPNVDFIKESIYEDINEEALYKLFDLGSIIIEESVET